MNYVLNNADFDYISDSLTFIEQQIAWGNSLNMNAHQCLHASLLLIYEAG